MVFRRQGWYLFHLVRQAILLRNAVHLLLIGRTTSVEDASHLLEVALKSGRSNDLKQAGRSGTRVPECMKHTLRLDNEISWRCQEFLVTYLYSDLTFKHIRIFILAAVC